MIESEPSSDQGFLKDNVQNIQRLMTLPRLGKFETDSLKQLLSVGKIREYDNGEIIIKEGDKDPWMYILLSGEIGVKKDGVDISIIDREGEIFGEMRMLDGLDRSASVYAKGKTVCLAVNTSAATYKLTSDERADVLLLLYRIFTEYIGARLCLVNDELTEAKKEVERLMLDR